MKKLILVFLALFDFANASDIVVGGKNFTEQQFLSEMTTQFLEAKGFSVDKKSGMGSTVLRKAQIHGQIDLYWEYTGTSLITYNKVKDKLNADEVYERVKMLDAKVGLVWLNPSKANNTYALAMRNADKIKYNINSISDLAKAINDKKDIKVGMNSEFSARADGMIGVEKTYKFKIPRKLKVKMDTGLIYTALNNKNIEVGVVFATDGRVSAFDFYILEDDKNFFPNYAIVPVIRADTLKKFPQMQGLLNKISSILTDEIMQKINRDIAVNKKPIKEVAKNFLSSHGLI